MFNALDLMENKEFLETLKFGIGDGNLQYYLYNWRCPPVAPNKVSYERVNLMGTNCFSQLCKTNSFVCE